MSQLSNMNKNKRKRRPRNGTSPQKLFNNPTFSPTVMPSHMDTWLTFRHNGALTNGAGSAASKYFDVNCAYDVDPALGSTSTAGFAEWSALYKYYRVLKFQVILEVVNYDESALSIVHGPFNLSPPGATTSYDSYIGNRHFRQHLIAPAGGGNVKTRFVTPVLDISQFVGDKNPYTDPNYASVSDDVPSNKIFWGFSIQTIAGSLANGVVYQVAIRMGVRFTEAVVLSQ